MSGEAVAQVVPVIPPCPFCGSGTAPVVHTDGGYTHEVVSMVVCNTSNGGCGATGGQRDSEAGSLTAWSTRA